jgi:hypothetical protein
LVFHSITPLPKTISMSSDLKIKVALFNGQSSVLWKWTHTVLVMWIVHFINVKSVITGFVTRLTRWCGTCGAAGTAYPSGWSVSTQGVARSLVFCVMFCISFCSLSFGHCVVCALMYDFWLPIWYLQIFLTFGCCSEIGVVTGVSVSFAVIRRMFDQLTVGCGNAIILCFLLFRIMRNIGVVS